QHPQGRLCQGGHDGDELTARRDPLLVTDCDDRRGPGELLLAEDDTLAMRIGRGESLRDGAGDAEARGCLAVPQAAARSCGCRAHECCHAEDCSPWRK